MTFYFRLMVSLAKFDESNLGRADLGVQKSNWNLIFYSKIQIKIDKYEFFDKSFTIIRPNEPFLKRSSNNLTNIGYSVSLRFVTQLHQSQG